jgi:hypothetical protein
MCILFTQIFCLERLSQKVEESSSYELHFYAAKGMIACNCRYVGYVEDDKVFILSKN